MKKTLTAACATLTLVGCTQQTRETPARLTETPMPASQLAVERNYEPSIAFYGNGDTVAGSTGFAYEPASDRDGSSYYYADFGTYLVNMATLPFTLASERGEVVYAGLTFPPTYHAMPELPPSPEDPSDAVFDDSVPAPTPGEPVRMDPVATDLMPDEPAEALPGLTPSDVAVPGVTARSLTIPDGQNMTLDEVLMVIPLEGVPDSQVEVTIIQADGVTFATETLDAMLRTHETTPVVLRAGETIRLQARQDD